MSLAHPGRDRSDLRCRSLDHRDRCGSMRILRGSGGVLLRRGRHQGHGEGAGVPPAVTKVPAGSDGGGQSSLRIDDHSKLDRAPQAVVAVLAGRGARGGIRARVRGGRRHREVSTRSSGSPRRASAYRRPRSHCSSCGAWGLSRGAAPGGDRAVGSTGEHAAAIGLVHRSRARMTPSLEQARDGDARVRSAAAPPEPSRRRSTSCCDGGAIDGSRTGCSIEAAGAVRRSGTRARGRGGHDRVHPESGSRTWGPSVMHLRQSPRREPRGDRLPRCSADRAPSSGTPRWRCSAMRMPMHRLSSARRSKRCGSERAPPCASPT